MSNTLPPPGRGLRVGLTIAVAAAAVGFFTGTRNPAVSDGRPSAPREPAGATVTRAPRQADMETARYAARRVEQATALAAMAIPPRGLLDPVERSEAAYDRDVAARAEGRAYDGAPPTVPHAVDQRGAPACLACHERGLSVKGKVARPLSHPSFANCMQCHVTREGVRRLPDPLPPSVSEESAFLGLMPPLHGGRAFVASPPQLPHRSFMRERCTSCHGVWAGGIATSHPARQSCTQCHALSAKADQMPIATLAELPALEAAP